MAVAAYSRPRRPLLPMTQPFLDKRLSPSSSPCRSQNLLLLFQLTYSLSLSCSPLHEWRQSAHVGHGMCVQHEGALSGEPSFRLRGQPDAHYAAI